MPGWGKLVAGALIGVAGTIYATNEEFRKKLPRGAQDLPVALRKRFENAVAAGREASSDRRAEILRALEEHEAAERGPSTVTASPVAAPQTNNALDDGEKTSGGRAASVSEDATRPLGRIEDQ